LVIFVVFNVNFGPRGNDQAVDRSKRNSMLWQSLATTIPNACAEPIRCQVPVAVLG
jgi:hypothetical protein